MNFQYFVVTLRLFVLTRDKDLRSGNESSPRRRVTSVTALPNAVYGRLDRPGVALLIWKPYLLYEDVREHCALAQRSQTPKSSDFQCFLNFDINFQYF